MRLMKFFFFSQAVRRTTPINVAYYKHMQLMCTVFVSVDCGWQRFVY